MPKLHLVQIIVQPMFMIEDDDGIMDPLQVEPTSVSPRDWPEYAKKGFDAAVAELRRNVEGDAKPAPRRNGKPRKPRARAKR